MCKIYKPRWAEEFNCLADKCPDTCCARWEIPVDADALAVYNNMNGETGEKIHAALSKDDEGDNIFALKNGRCPFLNDKNLCDIYEYRCEVCRQHPDFIEEYDCFTEITPSISCPAARDVILSASAENAYPAPDEESKDDVLNILMSARRMLLKSIPNIGFNAALTALFEVSDMAQYEIANIEADAQVEYPDIRLDDYISFLRDECEILTDEWRDLISKTDVSRISFIDDDEILTRALCYYIYRYFLKSVNDLKCPARARFIAYSVLAPAEISRQTGAPIEEVIRLYSKEIEHDPDNIDAIMEFLTL